MEIEEKLDIIEANQLQTVKRKSTKGPIMKQNLPIKLEKLYMKEKKPIKKL